MLEWLFLIYHIKWNILLKWTSPISLYFFKMWLLENKKLYMWLIFSSYQTSKDVIPSFRICPYKPHICVSICMNVIQSYNASTQTMVTKCPSPLLAHKTQSRECIIQAQSHNPHFESQICRLALWPQAIHWTFQRQFFSIVIGSDDRICILEWLLTNLCKFLHKGRALHCTE